MSDQEIEINELMFPIKHETAEDDETLVKIWTNTRRQNEVDRMIRYVDYLHKLLDEEGIEFDTMDEYFS